jgi:hypothetical protein
VNDQVRLYLALCYRLDVDPIAEFAKLRLVVENKSLVLINSISTHNITQLIKDTNTVVLKQLAAYEGIADN